LTVAQLKAETDKDYKNRMALVEEGKSNTLSLGSSFDAEAINLFSDPKMITAYAAGTLDDKHTLFLNNAIDRYTTPQSIFDPVTKTFVESKNEIGQELLAAINARKSLELNLSVPTRYSGTITTGTSGTGTSGAEILSNDSNEFDFKETDFVKGISDVNFKEGTGPYNAVLGLASDLLGVFTGKSTADKTKNAQTALRALNTETVLSILQTKTGKAAQDERDEIRNLLPKPGSIFETDDRAVSKITQVIGFLDRSIDAQNQILKTNITSAPETVAAKSAIIKLNNLKTSWNLIKKSYSTATGSLKKDDDGILRNKDGKSIDDFLITVPVLGNSGGNTK
jgi:hypothetical protein